MAMRMQNPAHPGAVLKELWLEPEDISVTQLAAALSVSRKTVSAILNGRARVTAAMALRLAKAFGTTAEVWLNMQQNYDLWQASQRGVDKDVKPLIEAGEAA